ncbi:MAG: response regulator [Thaumarchaeota archaeon]|nr:response regulator [Nitrososphaerota archaeon]
MHYSITISLPEAMVRRIDEICIKQESSRQDLIRKAVSRMIFEATSSLQSKIPITHKISDMSEINSQKSEHRMHDEDHSIVNAIVIEDDVDARDSFVELLQTYNIKVIGTGINGKEAGELYEKLHPDIVFMDVIMPAYDGHYGLDAISRINPNAKIVFVTGAVLNKNDIYKHNTTEIVEKPFQMERISKIIQKMMECN